MSRASNAHAAGQVLVVGFSGLTAPPELLEAARLGELGGVILFKRNLGSVHDVTHLIASIVSACPEDEPPLVAVDQEGGRVQRLKAPVVQLPPMQRLAALGDVGLTERAGQLLGRQLAALGFSMDFAPVLDIDTNPENPVIGDRAFGRTPAEVIEHALAFARGLHAGGVLSCGKHFPGHGDTDLDSHLALPRLPHHRARLDDVELAPFKAACGVIPALMTAHVVFDTIAPNAPATLSRAVVHELLRDELGYDGAVISDDLEMKAVADHYGIAEAACLAVEAGCDIVLICSKLDEYAAAKRALAARADTDAAFAARLHDAAQRSLALRRRVTPKPITDAAALLSALDEEEARAFERALQARG